MSMLKIASIGDLHFGNNRIDAAELYAKLKKFFYPVAEKADIVTVNGDIYDQLLTVNSKAYAYATEFINDLFRMSENTGCHIRLLHGTYSHDRDQLSIFSSLATERTKYKIITGIYAEVIDFPDKQLSVGYVPDNLPFRSVTEVLTGLRAVMAGHDKLDILIGHGTFAHTLPKHIPLPPITYTDNTFSDIVTGVIIMGHIHVHSKHGNIYYCGSFDRMSHNEEENKGFYSFTYKDGKWSDTFHVNRDATPFISLTFNDKDVSTLVRKYIAAVSAYKNTKAYVRVIHPDPEMRAVILKLSLTEFPEICISARTPKDIEQKELVISEINKTVVDDVKPCRENLGELVFKFLSDKHMLTDKFTKDKILDAVNCILR